MWLIVGLGNPGRKYQFTRHNIGFRVIDLLSKDLAILLHKRGLMTKWGIGLWEQREVVLSKPQTFMNLSGAAVVRMVEFFQVETEDMIVIHDDLDLNLGEIRIQEKGGDGGHKGVKSIIDSLGRSGFLRVRMGIGRPDKRGYERDYVLEVFDGREKKVLRDHLIKGKEAVKTVMAEGASAAMNRFNRRKRNSP